MASSKITVTVEINAEKIEKLYDALKGLQTYKLAENDDRTLVDTDDIVEVLADYITTYTERKTERWIPVTERLPEIDMSHPHHENYLVQYDSGGIDVASWSNVNRFWTNHVTEPYWNCVQFAKVIAWMPLPESYKEVEDHDQN